VLVHYVELVLIMGAKHAPAPRFWRSFGTLIIHLWVLLSSLDSAVPSSLAFASSSSSSSSSSLLLTPAHWEVDDEEEEEEQEQAKRSLDKQDSRRVSRNM